MTRKSDLGLEAVRRIAKLWLVDDDRIEWLEDGFEWWPGRFKVSVHSEKHPQERFGQACRVIIKTALLKDVPPDDRKTQRTIFEIANRAPSYAWVYPPAELAALRTRWEPEKYTSTEPDTFFGRTVWLQSTAYLHEENAGWFPEFFGRLAILQPIHAEAQAEDAARIIGGQPDTSRPSETQLSHPDEILDIESVIYEPLGRQPSRWQGSAEFAEIKEEFGRTAYCFGVSDPNGLTLETSFGPATAMVVLRADSPHPSLGAGLRAEVRLPFTGDEDVARYDSICLNYMEASFWTDIPHLGTWCPQHSGRGLFEACSTIFIPNALYLPNVAINVATWQLARARWAKHERWPSLKDVTMPEILEQRFGRQRRTDN